MAYRAKIGEMRTPITVWALTSATDSEGFRTETLTDLFDGEQAWCKWVTAHGKDELERDRMNMEHTATLTMYYCPAINERCRIEQTGSGEKWEVVSINNVEGSNAFMEVRVRRKVKA